MKKILIATGNPGKFKQMQSFLAGLPYEFLSLKEFDFEEEPVEDGDSFAANALIKAKFFAEKTKLAVIAEDSGLLVDALPGELGVTTRRWGAGDQASDQQWIDFFMNRMANEKVREAEFVSHITFFDGSDYYDFVGTCRGIITETLEAPIETGIPLSSCFKPDGYDQVYAALSHYQRLNLSHRGKAAYELRQFLNFDKEKFQRTLKNIRSYNNQNESWIVSEKVGQFLYEQAKAIKAKRILEIGTSIGYSGLWLARVAAENNGHLYTIESHKKRFALAETYFHQSGLSDYIIQIKGHAPEDIPEISQPWDLLFFDATKKEHLNYFLSLKDKLRIGAVIIVDNTVSHQLEMSEFLKLINADNDFELRDYSEMDKGILWARKIS